KMAPARMLCLKRFPDLNIYSPIETVDQGHRRTDAAWRAPLMSQGFDLLGCDSAELVAPGSADEGGHRCGLTMAQTSDERRHAAGTGKYLADYVLRVPQVAVVG